MHSARASALDSWASSRQASNSADAVAEQNVSSALARAMAGHTIRSSAVSAAKALSVLLLVMSRLLRSAPRSAS
jgi:hypothetical protein